MRKVAAFFGLTALVLGLNAMPAQAATIPLAQVNSGDLIRGQSFSAVYYLGKDGLRYVFPNDKTYFTWYQNFNTVKFITDADLASIQIGGNATYKPGSKMLKINSDPKTYAVDEGGKLRWVKTEAAAVGLYGANWNKMIDDVPDAFFSNYTLGADIEVAADFSPSSASNGASNIDDDKNLKEPTIVEIQDNQFSTQTVTVPRGTAVKFVNKGANKHTATADDLSWGTGTLTTGQSFTRYFKSAGTFPFFCSYHPSMTATIVVQ